MADQEAALRAMQNCFHSKFSTEVEDEDSTDHHLETSRRETSFDNDSIYLACTLSQTFDPGDIVPHHSPVIKMGWLDKTPPQGSLIFQKRWVTLDAEYLRYYQNEKEVYSKRIIVIPSIIDVLSVGEQKFEVLAKNRTFLFRAENNMVREEWVATLKQTIAEVPFTNSTNMPGQCDREVSLISKQGYLEMNGLRSKLYVVICADRFFLYRNTEEHSQGVGITSVDMNMGSVKSTDKRAFNLTTLYKTFRNKNVRGPSPEG